MTSYKDELYHYGVKGMKWGVIRWKDDMVSGPGRVPNIGMIKKTVGKNRQNAVVAAGNRGKNVIGTSSGPTVRRNSSNSIPVQNIGVGAARKVMDNENVTARYNDKGQLIREFKGENGKHTGEVLKELDDEHTLRSVRNKDGSTTKTLFDNAGNTMSEQTKNVGKTETAKGKNNKNSKPDTTPHTSGGAQIKYMGVGRARLAGNTADRETPYHLNDPTFSVRRHRDDGTEVLEYNKNSPEYKKGLISEERKGDYVSKETRKDYSGNIKSQEYDKNGGMVDLEREKKADRSTVKNAINYINKKVTNAKAKQMVGKKNADNVKRITGSLGNTLKSSIKSLFGKKKK